MGAFLPAQPLCQSKTPHQEDLRESRCSRPAGSTTRPPLFSRSSGWSSSSASELPSPASANVVRAGGQCFRSGLFQPLSGCIPSTSTSTTSCHQTSELATYRASKRGCRFSRNATRPSSASFDAHACCRSSSLRNDASGNRAASSSAAL
jgi:hypothetical protein